MVHLVVMVTSHVPVLLDVLDQVLRRNLSRLVGHGAALVAQGSRAQWTLDLEGRGPGGAAAARRAVHHAGGVQVGGGEQATQVAVFQSQVEVEVGVDVRRVVHGCRGSGSLVEGVSSRDDVLGEVEHVLGRGGRCHQVGGVQVQVMEHLVGGLATQLQLHLGQEAHHLVNVGALLEERQQRRQGL